ncbi:unnamed protein product, partial [Brassica napus]
RGFRLRDEIVGTPISKCFTVESEVNRERKKHDFNPCSQAASWHRVIRSNRVIVEGKNLIKKHIKGGPDHGIFTVDTTDSSIIKNTGSTLGACGDLNRNVLAPAASYNLSIVNVDKLRMLDGLMGNAVERQGVREDSVPYGASLS